MGCFLPVHSPARHGSLGDSSFRPPVNRELCVRTRSPSRRFGHRRNLSARPGTHSCRCRAVISRLPRHFVDSFPPLAFVLSPASVYPSSSCASCSVCSHSSHRSARHHSPRGGIVTVVTRPFHSRSTKQQPKPRPPVGNETKILTTLNVETETTPRNLTEGQRRRLIPLLRRQRLPGPSASIAHSGLC